MKNKKIYLLIPLLFSSLYAEEVPETIFSKKNIYIGVSINMNINKELVNTLSVRSGYNFNNYFGIETRYSTILNNKDLKNDISFFLKPQYNINNINLYSLLGYSFLNITGIENSFYDNNFKWGVGIEYSIEEKTKYPISIYVDYTDLYKKDDFLNSIKDEELNSINIGFTYKF